MPSTSIFAEAQIPIQMKFSKQLLIGEKSFLPTQYSGEGLDYLHASLWRVIYSIQRPP